MNERIIDTHVHVWDLAKAEYGWLKGNQTILNQNWEIASLETERTHVGITEGVLVQASINLEDSAWMFEVAGRTEWIVGVVAWLPLLDPAASAAILKEQYLKNAYFKGVRHLIHDEKNPRWLLQDPVIESLKLLAEHDIPYDVVGTLPEHLETAITVGEKIPGLRMVLDHLNQPPVASNERFGRWGELMKRIAENPNMHAKISGLGTTTGDPDKWTSDDIAPYVEFVIRNFGVERCFCGGDWPVSLLAGSYLKTWSEYKKLLARLVSDEERKKILSENAERFYRL